MPRSRQCAAQAALSGAMMEPEYELDDEQWKLIADVFPPPRCSPKGGRPPAGSRECFEGICWVLRRGARWKDLPNHFPSPSTCWRRLRDWTQCGAWARAWSRLLRKLQQGGQVQTEEAIADGTFCSAKKGAAA